ncbi:MAG: integrin alpha [Bacteriovoracaceae bacterium]|nr:integrin alpha [Bacteriovoracaceae bacterium]
MRNWSVVIFSFLFFLQKEFPAKNIRAKIAQTTFEVSSRDERWKISYDLIGFGKNNQIIKPSSLIASAKGPNLSLKNTQLEIYYHNSTAGIRQDFIIYQKPIDQGDLQLYLNVETPFDLYVSDSKVVHSEKNKIMASYENLNVFDARGMKLDAKFVLANHQLKIEVKDQFAQYPIRIDPLTTTPSWVVKQNQANASFGYTVSYVGDVNGDGFGDVLIGAPYFDNGFTDEGRVFLYYGSVNGLQSTAAWSYSCGKVDCQLGYSIDGAGKINNDVYADIIIGATNYSNGQVEEGEAFIFYGASSGPQSPLVAVGGQASANLGKKVTSAGDVDGDGFDDIAIAAPMYDNGQTNEGRVYIYLGSSVGISITSSWQAEGNLASGQFGQGLAGDFDMNGDGFDDLVIGAPVYKITSNGDGAVFSFYGSAN